MYLCGDDVNTHLVKNQEMDILAKLESIYKIKPERRNDRQAQMHVPKELVSSVLLYAKNRLGYIHLNHISCVDWIEKKRFELVYIIWNPGTKHTLLIKTFVDRENPEMENIDTIWDQAHTYEREIREMFGIEFPGLQAPREFILEDWTDMPPMRRDFDTRKYAFDHYETRPGREDAKDVREHITRRTGEKLPDFAKKYSRD
jgi:NADH-quinone oxidoreductase subunit C